MRNKEKRREYWKNILVFKKIKAVEYKGGKCQCCGYNKCYGALGFHHRDPSQKDFGWNKLRSFSWDRIKKELDKCDILCANCHQELHTPRSTDEIWEWRSKIDAKKCVERLQVCPVCKLEFHTIKDKATYCSHDCWYRSLHRTEWPDNLPELVAESSKLAVARMLGVSDKAVSKRLLRHHS